jgi:hypothetical protein
MIRLTVDVDTTQVSQLLSYLPIAVGQNLRPYSRRVGQTLQRYIQTQKLSGQALNARTGASRRAIFYRLEEGLNAGGAIVSQTVVIGGDLKVAPGLRIHEYGGTIHGKPYLAIPIGEALTAQNKVARFRARDLKANPSAYGYVGSFIRNGVIFGVRGHGRTREILPLFVLKRSVTLKRVGWLASTAREQATTVVGIYREATAQAIKDATAHAKGAAGAQGRRPS